MNSEQDKSSGIAAYLQLNDRQSLSLDGQWGFYADNMGAFGLKRSRNIFEGLNPVEEDRAVEYDVDAFEQISVPGDWNTQKKEWLLFEGFGWYARRLKFNQRELEELKGLGRIFLRLDGVNYATEVWWNGEKVGEVELPFLPLSFEIEPDACQAENLLVIRVDARRLPHRIPSEKYDWFNYGGLIRSVRLVSTPHEFIAHAGYHGTRILSQQSGEASVNGTYALQFQGIANGTDYEARITLPELSYTQTVSLTGDELNVALEGIDVQLWQPGKARLYAAEIELVKNGTVVDKITQRIGFKEVTWRDAELFVNGDPIYLKGIALHEERLGEEGGKPRGLEDVRALIDLAQETGCNYLRLAHYPYGEEWLRECDERGLLVWDEIPVYWEITYADARTEEIIYNSAVRMVELSRGHPCILCHAMANETWELPERKRVMGRAFDAIKKLDPSIPATAAFNAPYRDNAYDVESVGHSIYEFVDIVGLNEYGGWYNPPVKELPDARIVVGNKPLLITEFGAAGPVGADYNAEKLWNCESQKRIYEEQLALFERTEKLSGWTPWALKDFRSTLRANGFQRGWNRKGLVSQSGEKKPVFETVKAAFAKAEAALANRG
ncbi:glycoside hydrolase family 2 protein [Cerasicoccus fimbriatus]|uniref:glycoside hydrolase family 2 protein n=1 Tax=Cerasicoccus fimbriatus TaxID=3014554 RepID=UPI0022B503F0|nr:glycoside hydrolase family 2 TIM barrel-domain containing protein [Cerasicoccus sp. TK19100]